MTHLILILLVILPAMLLLIGAALIIIALRGRRIDDHPLCRRCGFDLIGSSGSARCPECGSEILPERIRYGHRAYRRRQLVVGLVLGVPSLLVLLGLGIVIFRGTDLEPYKPFWLLMRERDTPAIVELNRRATAGRLSQHQDQRLLAAALDAQADLKQPWLVAWGNLIESLRAAGKVPDKDWRRYARQAVNFTLDARPRIRIGDVIPVQAVYPCYRAGSSSRLKVHVRMMRALLDDVRLDGLLPEKVMGGGQLDFLSRRGSSWTAFHCLEVPSIALSKLRPGKHRLRAILAISVLGAGTGGTWGPTLDERRDTLETTVTLLPKNQPTVELIRDPLLRPKIVAGISIDSRSPTGRTQSALQVDRDGIEVTVVSDHPPVGLAFDVFVRDSTGREWKLLGVGFPAGKNYGYGTIGEIDGFAADSVDVILRSSIDAASRTTYLTRIWDGEIVLHNIKVTWSPGTPRPWTRWRAPSPTTTPASVISQPGSPKSSAQIK